MSYWKCPEDEWRTSDLQLEGNKDEHSPHKNQTLSCLAFLYYHSLVMIIDPIILVFYVKELG